MHLLFLLPFFELCCFTNQVKRGGKEERGGGGGCGQGGLIPLRGFLRRTLRPLPRVKSSRSFFFFFFFLSRRGARERKRWMGKGMQETNECSRQESGNVGETIVPPPQDSAGSGCKHIGRERRWGVKSHTWERERELCSFYSDIHIHPDACCLHFPLLWTHTDPHPCSQCL